jgi:hypothetical protein
VDLMEGEQQIGIKVRKAGRPRLLHAADARSHAMHRDQVHEHTEARHPRNKQLVAAEGSGTAEEPVDASRGRGSDS